MKIIADENIYKRVVVRLREAGYAVEWIRETARGAADDAILGRSDVADFVFITNDSDFGELIFAQAAPLPYCILFSRLPHRLADLMVERLIELLETGVPSQSIVTLTATGNRIKHFPGVHNG